MKLTTVLGSVNDNKEYYRFIPKQILFWGKFGIKFIALFVGNNIPRELEKYSANIILWNHNLDINTAFVGQNLRMYYASLLKLPDDEMVMITDMDMLPANKAYYVTGLENYTKDDFIYYRNIHYNPHPHNNEIYMCYNAAHPDTWAKLFNIKSEDDIINALNATYNTEYDGPNGTAWLTDQYVMYNTLHKYEHLVVLNRPIKRLDRAMCEQFMRQKNKNYMHKYDDMHFHRSYSQNVHVIADVEMQLRAQYPE